MQLLKDIGTYTFPALLKNSVKKFSERGALSFVDKGLITYSDLEELSQKASRILFSLGLKKGDKAAILSLSCPNWGASYFGIVNTGIIAVPLLPDFNSLEIETILKHAGISAIFVHKKLFNKIKDLSAEILPAIIDIETFEVLRGNMAMEEANAVLPDVAVLEDDTASIIYTSGTTGRSKGVELTHKNLVWTAIQCQTVHRVNKLDKCLSFLPLSHVYEFTIGFTMQLLNGACVYYLGGPVSVSALLAAFKKVRPTIVLSVPLIMEKIYKNKILPTFNKSPLIKKLYGIRFFQKIFHRIAGKSLMKTFGGRIKFFGIGGAKVDTPVEIFLKDAKFPYAIGYGLTETSPLLAGSGPKITIPGTVGPVMQGVQLAVLNPNEEGIGEIVAKGPNVMKGYYKDPELTKAAFTSEEDSVGAGWFRTGDLGEIRNGIWLILKGRLKNMILGNSGENIYPEDIEFILNQHPLVLESLVVEDENGLVALVQLDEEKIKKEKHGIIGSVTGAVQEAVKDIAEDFSYQQEAILNEIQFFVNQKVNRISKIGKIKKIDNFEKTASQKIKRYLYSFKKKK